MAGVETSKLEELIRRIPKNSGIDPRLIEEAKVELNVIKFRTDPYNQRQKQWTKTDVERLQDALKEKDTEIQLLKRQLINRSAFKMKTFAKRLRNGTPLCTWTNVQSGELFSNVCKRFCILNAGTSVESAETPAQIREHYKRLFDYEWKDLYDYFRSRGWNEIEIIVTLQRILRASYSFCQDVAKEQLENIEGEALYPSASWMDDNGILTRMKKKEITKEIVSLAKLYQRTTSQECVPALRKAFKIHVVPTFIDPTKYSDKRVERYVHLCIDITWLMCVQDPPMVLVDRIDRGSEFDTEMFRKYVNSEGDRFDYLVWPALLSEKNGSVIVKGIARPIQLKRESPIDSRAPTVTLDDDRSMPKSRRDGEISHRSRNPEDLINMATDGNSVGKGTQRSERKGQTPPSLYVQAPTRERQPSPRAPYFDPHRTPMFDATDDVTPRRYSTPPSENIPTRDNLTVMWRMKRPERSAP